MAGRAFVTSAQADTLRHLGRGEAVPADPLAEPDWHALIAEEPWDALIVEAARRAGATRLISDDLQTGRRLAGVLIDNPFASTS